MHQSRMFSIHSRYTLFQRSGTNRTRPSLSASMAGRASGFIFTNHCGDRRGSTTVWQR